MQTAEFLERRKRIAQYLYSQCPHDSSMDVYDWYVLLGRYSVVYDPGLADMAAFIIYAGENNISDTVWETLVHDLSGVNERFPEMFLPRTSGYANYI